jgi:inhibitor of apoptosis domain-containing protein
MATSLAYMSEADRALYGIKFTRGPSNMQYVSIHSRIESFASWPGTQSIQEMALAGFYQLPNTGRVVCFYCGGGLKDWEPGDDPWFEHAKWYPKCVYIYLNKGYEYVRDTVGMKVINIF